MADAARVTADPAATSLAVSGGTAVGAVTFDLGAPTNAFALTIANGFAVAGQLSIGGTLLAGSSVSITGLKITTPLATNSGTLLKLEDLQLTDASLTITDSIVTPAPVAAPASSSHLAFAATLPSATRRSRLWSTPGTSLAC